MSVLSVPFELLSCFPSRLRLEADAALSLSEDTVLSSAEPAGVVAAASLTSSTLN